MESLQNYLKLMRADKPIGTLLLLWPTLMALLIASRGHPSSKLLMIFIVGVFVTRAAGCIVNDLLDRKLDQHVARTKERPLASGAVSIKNALLLLVALLVVALVFVLQLNALTFLMAIVAVILAGLYPLMKRIMHLPQIWLGIAFNWGILMAFTAVDQHLSLIAFLLYLSAISSTVAYDTMYAMVDKKDDLKIGIKSTAILFGSHDRHIIAVFQVVTLLLLIIVGSLAKLNLWYDLGWLLAAILAFYQQCLIKDRKPEQCFAAFLNNNYFWAAIFLGTILAYLSAVPAGNCFLGKNALPEASSGLHSRGRAPLLPLENPSSGFV